VKLTRPCVFRGHFFVPRPMLNEGRGEIQGYEVKYLVFNLVVNIYEAK